MGQDNQDRKSTDPVKMIGRDKYRELKSRDIGNERRIFKSEIAMIFAGVLLIAIYVVALMFKLGSLPVPLWLTR